MNKLKAIRKTKRLTLDDVVAGSVVCSKGHLSDIEGGKVEPGVNTALSIAKALRTTVEKIWGDA